MTISLGNLYMAFALPWVHVHSLGHRAQKASLLRGLKCTL